MITRNIYDLIIIGGGAAGITAAISANNHHIHKILLIDRNPELGGILNQCIHNGFGLHYYQRDLTGIEFAKRLLSDFDSRNIEYLTNANVISVTKEKTVTVISPSQGLQKLQGRAIILATGCREKTRSDLLIPGSRCAGIYSAGTAQFMLNKKGCLPGKKVAILGSGNIGLIMARQLLLEGVEICAIIEKNASLGGSPRNIQQSVIDFHIPVFFNSTISWINGNGRISSITVTILDSSMRPISGSDFSISCDALLISAGLIPNNELCHTAELCDMIVSSKTNVDDNYMCRVPGFFLCGNLLNIHDLVDEVCEEGIKAGEKAAKWLKS